MKFFKITVFAIAISLMSFASLNSISWKSDTIDVGEIPQNKPKIIVFEFKNTGKSDVLITNAQGSCGCTATDYTKTPIKTGQTGTISATYNAAGIGAFAKTITVSTSVEAPKVLTLKGVVQGAAVTEKI